MRALPYRRLVGLVAALGALAGRASAQATRTAEDSTNRTSLSVNPLLLPFGAITVEGERATGSRSSLGASVNYFSPWLGDFDGDGLLSIDVKARFYPNETALRGFSIGVSGGVMRVRDNDVVECTELICRTERRTDVLPTVAVLADYNWYLSRRRDFLVGIGFGVKRVLRDDNVDWWIPRLFPNVRFQTGFRF